MDKYYNGFYTGLSALALIFLAVLVLHLTETIYIFLSEICQEIAFSGWAATILSSFLCLSNLSNWSTLSSSLVLQYNWLTLAGKKCRKFQQHSLFINKVLDYCVAAMVDPTTHLSSLLSLLEKSIYLLFLPLVPGAASVNLELLKDSYTSPANRRLWYYRHAKQR